jgi:hypothetical protein
LDELRVNLEEVIEPLLEEDASLREPPPRSVEVQQIEVP